VGKKWDRKHKKQTKNKEKQKTLKMEKEFKKQGLVSNTKNVQHNFLHSLHYIIFLTFDILATIFPHHIHEV